MIAAMIYTVHTVTHTCIECRWMERAASRPSSRHAQRGIPAEFVATTGATLQNKSLAFGPSITRRKNTCLHLCTQALPLTNFVNRLWYGRALVSMRTHPQTSRRAMAQQEFNP
jgi:hypothetical protein